MENPFLIKIEDKSLYTIDDYVDIQKKLSNINVDSIIDSLYPPKDCFYSLDEFKYRCTKSLKQQIIYTDDFGNIKLPSKILYRIRQGSMIMDDEFIYEETDGGTCIVCCTPFSHDLSNFDKYKTHSETRYLASHQIIKSLEEVGYDGFFYLFNGGFPSPTGTEMKYAGVPYCFKIFMMLEAKKKGFSRVIWIDSGCYCINNPKRLFDILDTQETLIKTISSEHNNYNAMCLPQTMTLLNSINNNDIQTASYVETIVFGLNMKSDIINKFIEDYYGMVKLGYPFLSIFPEEIVFTSLFNRGEYKHLLYRQTPECHRLQIHEDKIKDSFIAKNNGYYFHHRNYKKYVKGGVDAEQPSSEVESGDLGEAAASEGGDLSEAATFGGDDSNFVVSFDQKGGRFGNQIFKYIICKLFTIKLNHVYLCSKNFLDRTGGNYITITEENLNSSLINLDNKNKNIFCVGYFQKSDFFVKYRKELIEVILETKNNDYWEDGDVKYYIQKYFKSRINIPLKNNDVCMHVRLDDFIQTCCKTSDILPPQYYIEILENIYGQGGCNKGDSVLYIICDKLHYEWENKYMEFFKKWNPIFTRNSLMEDISIMKNCNVLIHSNSTLCWAVSFLSEKKMRYIPFSNKEYMNQNQALYKIEESDYIRNVMQLDHDEVYKLDTRNNTIFPLSFCVPDECLIDLEEASSKGGDFPTEKKKLLADLIPGDMSTYIYKQEDENLYNNMYREARFALTKMKGGWDCLRHYEILMNGCIPLFENLKDCPEYTLTTYPKKLNMEAYLMYYNWSETSENIEKYNVLRNKFLRHTMKYCTTSSATRYFLKKINGGSGIKNILMITCHHGINYNRESLWIGLKRHIKSIGGVSVEYGKMPFLYSDFRGFQEGDNIAYSGVTFTLPKRIEKDENYDMGESEIIEKIKSNFWDLIIYGKVGPDELISELPLYDIVKTRFNKNKIVFIYGGDEIFNLNANEYSSHTNIFGVCIKELNYCNHLKYYSQFGYCFVRELDYIKKNINSLLDIDMDLFRVYAMDNKFRFGDNNDGGYVLCELNTNYDCFISGGIASSDDFSYYFIEKYNIRKEDCYGVDGTVETLPGNLIGKMNFIKKNIGSNETDKITTLVGIIEKFNNVFVKMDIEGGEWEWFSCLKIEDLSKIAQLVIELHGITDSSWHYGLTFDKFGCDKNLKVEYLRKLNKTHYLVHAHGNNADKINICGIPNVIELTYVNKKYFNKKPDLNRIPLPIKSLDYSNDRLRPDYSLNFYPFTSRL